MDKNKCNSCGEAPHKCSCKNKDFTKSVIEIDNPEQITLMRKVVIPTSMGDDTTVPPVVGKYHNVLLYYEANSKSYLYSSDGIPTQLVNGVTDYEQAVNLPQINGNTLIGDKTGDQLGLQNKLTAGENITIEDDVISATDTTYGPATDTEIGLVKPGDGLEVDASGTMSISNVEQYAHFFDTVADMKAATNLTDGSYAGTYGYYTRNDGGGALYKIRSISNDDVVDERFIIGITGSSPDSLVAELVHGKEINVRQMGVNDTNFSTIVNDLIDKRYNVYIPKGDYVATSTINVGRIEIMVTSDGNITSSASPMFYVYSYRTILRLNGKCTGSGDVNSVFMQISGNNYSSNSNNIYVHYATNFGVGFHLNPGGGKGCAYNKINFDLLACKKYGILIESGSGANFVNENWFNGGRIQGITGMLSGIKTIKGESQVDPYNGNVFDHICIDDNYDIAIDLDFAAYNHFNDFRLSEGAPANYYIKLHDGSFENRFSSKSFMPDTKVLDENTAWNHLNYFDVRLGSSGWQVAPRFKTNQGRKIVARDDYVASGDSDYSLAYQYNTTSYSSEPPFYVDGMTTVSFGHDDTTTGETFDYVLPAIFWGGGVKTFYMRIQFLAAVDDFTLKTSTGKLVADRNNVQPTGAINQKWYKVEYVGNIQGGIWKVFPVN